MIFVVFVFSILIHEITHIIVGGLFGYKLKKFRFVPFGTVIEFKETPKINKSIIKNLIVYISGPLSNFLICFFVYNSKISIAKDIFFTNFLLGIFNLFPITPLDGSKIIKELLKIFLDYKNSNIITYQITKIFLCLFSFLYAIFIVKFKNISLLIILVYLWYIDILENRRITLLKKVYNLVEKSNF